VTVSAIRRATRAEALEQVRHDPTLARLSLSSLAKRWGIARSRARSWMKGDVQAEPSVSPPVATGDRRLANLTAGSPSGVFLGLRNEGDIPRRAANDRSRRA
jgi:hypothetical protein